MHIFMLDFSLCLLCSDATLLLTNCCVKKKFPSAGLVSYFYGAFVIFVYFLNPQNTGSDTDPDTESMTEEDGTLDLIPQKTSSSPPSDVPTPVGTDSGGVLEDGPHTDLPTVNYQPF